MRTGIFWKPTEETDSKAKRVRRCENQPQAQEYSNRCDQDLDNFPETSVNQLSLNICQPHLKSLSDADRNH